MNTTTIDTLCAIAGTIAGISIVLGFAPSRKWSAIKNLTIQIILGAIALIIIAVLISAIDANSITP